MAPKPGNAFAQQKELQRQKDLVIQSREEVLPSTPMTTISMFIGPDPPQVEHQEPADLKSPSNVDPLCHSATGGDRLGKRAFTDPLGITAAHSVDASKPSSFGKQSSGLDYIKSKFTGKNKKNKSPESYSRPFTTSSPSQHLSHTSSSATMPNTHRIGAVPKAGRNVGESLRSQPLPSHLSTATTQSIATRQSQYASALRNDAMILGNMLMSPTRSGSYAVTGYPAIVGVSHPSIVSMAGSILQASPPSLDTSTIPHMYGDPSAGRETYDVSYIAPHPFPPINKLLENPPFHQQLPLCLQLQPQEQVPRTNLQGEPFSRYDMLNSGTWEQMHVQYPSTMPQFSPMNPKHLYENDAQGQTTITQASDNESDVDELQDTSIETLLYNANASDTKSESGMEVRHEPENVTVDIGISLRSSLRRSVSNYELRYASYRGESPSRTPAAEEEGQATVKSSKPSLVLSPTAPVFRPAGHKILTTMTPTTLKLGQYEGKGPKRSVPARDLAQDINRKVLGSHGESDASYQGEHRQALDSKGKDSSSAQTREDVTTYGGYPPTPEHPGYQARSSLEEQITHQFSVVHHHMDADKHTLRRCIEDAKNHLSDKRSCQVDDKFMHQFRQMCIQNNGFRQYLERIDQQTSSLRPGIARDVLPGVSVEMANKFAAHENHYQEEFRRMNRIVLTLNANVDAVQRNMNKQMALMNRKMDLLLEAQGIDFHSGGQYVRQNRDLMEQKLRQEAQRRQDEVMDPAAMIAKKEETATAAATSGASPPTTQVSSPITKKRNPTPLPAKRPLMAAALTSAPPHVPQLPQSQSQSSSVARVTITDPSIPSPSAITNARRIKQGDVGGQGDGRAENMRAGIAAKGLADMTPVHDLESHVHPALRYQAGIERLAGDKDKEQITEKKTEDDRNEVLWRRPSDNGEIGGRWYKAAMQQ